jgi:uncharacterized protein (TIGR02270 family)
MLLGIAQEHLEEAEFLFAARHRALRSELYDLNRLAELEERLDAHLDGLAGAAEEDWPGFAEGLGADDPGIVAAAVAGLVLGGRAEQVAAALWNSELDLLRGAATALWYVPLPAAIESLLLEALRDPASKLAALALDVLSAHGKLQATQLARFARNACPDVLAAAARAAGRVGGDVAWLEPLTRLDAATVREASLFAMLRRGAPVARDRCRQLAADPKLSTPETVRMLGAIGTDCDLQALRRLAGVEILAESALSAMAAVGTGAAVKNVLDLMADPKLGKGAGTAFKRITGISPVSQPSKAPSAAEEDATFEDTRPTPDTEATRQRWNQAARESGPDARYRNGSRIEAKTWRTEPNAGDLATRWEELLRLWSDGSKLLPALDLDAPAIRQLGACKGVS